MLLLTSHEGTVRDGRVVELLGLVVEALWALPLLDRLQSLIVVVTFEQFLNARSLQLGLVLDHLLRVGIFPLTVGVLGVEVVFCEGWHERCLHSLLHEGLPVEAGKPLVLLKDLRAFLTQAVRRFTLDKSVDEVGGLDGPAARNLILVDSDLL